MNRYPALFIGLHLLVASAAALEARWVYCVPLLILWAPLFSSSEEKKQLWIRCIGSFMLGGLFFAYATLTLPKAQPSQESLEGTLYFSIASLQRQQSPFQHSFAYKGTAHHFLSKAGEELTEIPCHIYLPIDRDRPPANADYVLFGTLTKTPHRFQFKPHSPWHRVPQTHSLAEWRFLQKEKIRRFLQDHIQDQKSAQFLSTLATGDLDERRISLEFGKLGMQHILAISGFHFALIAAFFCHLFRLFFPPKITDLLTLLLLTAYFFLIGNSPSVLRAWVAISLFLIGRLSRLRSSALNALGCALIAELCVDPQVVENLGFQLSFLCTFAILAAFPLLRALYALLLPIRSYKSVFQMPFIDQCGALLSTFFRNALALNSAVHLFAIPVTLLLFHKFPLLSLIYNLFFPALISLSLLLLCATAIALPLPPLASLLCQINSSYTGLVLDLCSSPPAALDYSLHAPFLSPTSVILFLSLLFFCSLRFQLQKI